MSTPSAFSRFITLINPVHAARDFWSVWRQENPYRLRIVAVSAALTFCIFTVMFGEEQRIEPRAPKITYISSYDPGRSDQEIIASNIANQERKEAEQADQEKRAAEVRARYEYVGRMFGMDVEEAKRKGEAERAAQAKAKEEARQRALAEIEARQGNIAPYEQR